MAIPARYVVHQGPVIATLFRTVAQAAMHKSSGTPLATPGPVLKDTVAPRPRDLIADYVRHVGGEPSAYRKVLPPHLFPQWMFPLQARTMDGLPYPIEKVLNAGCRMEIRAQLPIDEPLDISCQLVRVDDDGRRAVVHMRGITGTASAPEALITDMQALIPLSGGKGDKGDKKSAPKERVRVPDDAVELARIKLAANAGLDFAKLTGDFNPVHWIPPYAKAFGFRSTILHGFSSMARAYEGVVRGRLAGDINAIREFDVRFTRPLVLPAKVGVFVDGHDVFVGDAVSGPAYLTGSYSTL